MDQTEEYDVREVSRRMRGMQFDIELLQGRFKIQGLYGKYIAALTVAIVEGVFIGIIVLLALASK